MSKYIYPFQCIQCKKEILHCKDHRQGWCFACMYVMRKNDEWKFLPIIDPNIKLSERQREIIDGHLLGDGGLFQYGNAQHPYFAIQRATKDRSYSEWSVRELKNIVTPSGISDKSVFDKRTNKTYYNSKFQTARLSELTEFRKRWYPNDGKKVVPQDIELTALQIAIWFADDGNACIRSPESKYFAMKFSTNAFPKEDTERLAENLSDRYSENFRVHQNGNGYIIAAAHNGSMKMAEEIESVWPSGIDRKAFWKK